MGRSSSSSQSRGAPPHGSPLGHRGPRRGRLFPAFATAALVLAFWLSPATPGPATVSGAPSAGITAFTAAGANPAAIQGTVDAFRAALGANNGVGGAFPGGRREINWDGTPDAFSAPNNLPANFFNVNSPRGVVFAGPASAFQVSSTVASGVPVRFGNINPTYTALFSVFSSERLFTGLGSTIVDVDFFVPGTNTRAVVSGFGSVFTNVDNPNTTRIRFFDRNDVEIGDVIAPPGQLSFAAGQYDGSGPRIARVRIINGNTALGPNNAPPAIDVVVMDDFIYGEPQANTTTTTLGTVPTVATAGQPVTLTATVIPTATTIGQPTGLVGFRDGSVQIGTGTVLANGQATFTTTTLTPGTHTLTAVYLGDGTFGTSTSTPVTVTVTAAATATPITTLTVQQAIARVTTSGQQGQAAAFLPGQTVNVTGQVNGTGTVTGSMTWTLTATVPAGVAAGSVPVAVMSTNQGLQGFPCAAVAVGATTVVCNGTTSGNALQGSTVTVVFPNGATVTGTVIGLPLPPLPPPPPIVVVPPPPPVMFLPPPPVGPPPDFMTPRGEGTSPLGPAAAPPGAPASNGAPAAAPTSLPRATAVPTAAPAPTATPATGARTEAPAASTNAASARPETPSASTDAASTRSAAPSTATDGPSVAGDAPSTPLEPPTAAPVSDEPALQITIAE